MTNMLAVIVPSNIHCVENPGLLRTIPTEFVDIKVTGNPDARVVEPPNSKRQSLQGDSKDAM